MSGRCLRVPRIALMLVSAVVLAPAAAHVAAVVEWPAARVAASSPASPATDSAAGTTAADLAAAGDALYAAGDLTAAADAYADAAALGGLDAARAVRLGNACVRLGAPGRAMAAYRLAEAGSPRQPALRQNMAWLRAELAKGAASAVAMAGDGAGETTVPTYGTDASNGSNGSGASDASGTPGGTDGTDGTTAATMAADPVDLPVVDRAAAFASPPPQVWSPAWWAAASRAWASLDDLAALALGAWWAAVLALWAGRVARRRMARFAAGGAFGVALLASALLGARMVRRAAAQPAVVVAPRLVAVRQGPGMPFAAVRSVPEGAEVRYVERRGRWLRLADEGGESGGGGWIAASAVVDVPE